jgi:predicted N-acetyltransferase YhbS
MDMPPMTESVESVKEKILSAKVFVAKEGDKIVGAVRGEEKEGACCVARLWVIPEYQGKGIGQALMYAVEDAFSHLPTYKLFTGSKTPETISFYQERGYVEKSREAIKEYELVYFEKMNAMGYME